MFTRLPRTQTAERELTLRRLILYVTPVLFTGLVALMIRNVAGGDGTESRNVAGADGIESRNVAGASLVPGSIDFRGDFESRDPWQYSGFNCPDPPRQFQIVTSPVRQGLYAGRFEQVPAGPSSSCLASAADTGEREGQEYYYGFSMYFPRKISSNTLWELHMRGDIFSVDPNTAVVPHAIIADGAGGLRYNLLTGPAYWGGGAWTGWSHFDSGLSLGDDLDDYPTGTWIDFIVHLRFTESAEGLLEVWHRTGEGPWPAAPQLARYDVPTLQWIPGYDNQIWGYPNDPDVPNDIHTSSLYTAFGLYKGGPYTSVTDVVYHDGYRRGPSFAAVVAEFPQ